MSKAQGIAQSANQSQFKNRIINGNMAIDQRNAGASVSVTSSWAYCLDRFASRGMTGSGHTVQQSSTAPTGFVNSLKWTTGTGATVGSGDINGLFQAIEGYNFADLGWGTINAKTVTLSFWVYSSLTGTFGGSFKNDDGNRSYPFSYTISSANTWEQKTITVAGDTTGTWKTTNAAGTYLSFGLGVGSTYSNTAGSWAAGNYISCTGATNLVATSGATFYITGVQLEKGTVATSFDYRPYGTELNLCKRYFQIVRHLQGHCYNSATGVGQYAFGIEMRTGGTISTNSTTVDLEGFGTRTVTHSFQSATQYGFRHVISAGASNLSTNASYQLQDNIFANSEL